MRKVLRNNFFSNFLILSVIVDSYACLYFQPILKVFCVIVVPPEVEDREDPGDEPR